MALPRLLLYVSSTAAPPLFATTPTRLPIKSRSVAILESLLVRMRWELM